MVDGATGTEAVTGVFREKYKKLYNSVSFDSESMTLMKAQIDELIDKDCCDTNNHHKHTIFTADVEQALSSLKRNKNDGNVGHNTNHIINGSHKLLVYISLLFNSMLSHGFCPDGFLLSTIVPIRKCHKQVHQ